ncbi:MAG TPA: carboxypeptidase-like regulatory domain-containing protein [Chitinophagaceae bacterium]|nr:carboxypeptidase-like regulatory domain-containing protein [Chitinophagaceae bacterium]
MRKFLIIFIAILMAAVRGFAQVEGDVMDVSNKFIPNAIVIATDTVTKKMDTVHTDERGFYFFKNLKPGIHKFEAKATGFLPTVKFFKVNPAPEGANDSDDTYFAETLDIILKRPKSPK